MHFRCRCGVFALSVHEISSVGINRPTPMIRAPNVLKTASVILVELIIAE